MTAVSDGTIIVTATSVSSGKNGYMGITVAQLPVLVAKADLTSYDAVGNPLTDGTWTYTWQTGRQLKQMSKTGETVQFFYNDEGLRVHKVATSTGTTDYTLHGKQVVHLKNGTSELHFYYGSDGKPAFVRLGTAWYAYVHNLQGDVIALTDSSGTVKVTYQYDAWGKIISSTDTSGVNLAWLNPFRYRGYVYDEETGLYYLRSRYYRAEWGRFVNSDNTISFSLDLSLFRYCSNSSINSVDNQGHKENQIPLNEVPPEEAGYIPPKGGPKRGKKHGKTSTSRTFPTKRVSN